jgi:anti-sigma B factor antagonist
MTTYEVIARDGAGVAVITLNGRIDRDAMTALTAAYEEAVVSSPSTVLLDFNDVDYINSTGIALIVGVLGRARAEGRQIFASGLTEHYEHIFAITRLSDFIKIYSDVDAAVAGATSK